MSAGLLRDAAALAGAAGVLLLLLPVPRMAPRARRGAGLALALLAWAGLAGSLAGRADLDAVADRLLTPLGLVAALAGLGLLAGALGLATWATLRRPTAWFLLLGLALPVRVPIALSDGEQAKLLLPLYAVILVGVAAVVIGEVRAGRPPRGGDGGPRTPLDVPLALFVALLLASTLWSVDGPEAAVRGAFFYLPFTLLLLLTVALWPRARALRALALTTVGIGAAVAAIALGQFATGEIWWNATLQQANVYSRFFRVNAIFYDPNILGRFLAIGILAALGVALCRRAPRELAGLAALVALLTAGVAVTFSRSTALMLMTGAALLGARLVGPRRALAVGGTLLVLAGAAALATSDNVRRAATSTERLERVSEGRFDLMRGGLRIWREEPLLGVGLGGFGTRFTEGLTPVEQRRVRVVVSHNTPITVLSEAGLVGFALLCLLAVTAAVRLGRGSRGAGAPGWARWTALATLAGITVHSLFYAGLFEDPYTWVLAGVAAALVPAAGGAPAAAPREAHEAVAVP